MCLKTVRFCNLACPLNDPLPVGQFWMGQVRMLKYCFDSEYKFTDSRVACSGGLVVYASDNGAGSPDSNPMGAEIIFTFWWFRSPGILQRSIKCLFILIYS